MNLSTVFRERLRKHSILLVLLGLLLLGLFLRIYDLGSESLWLDEVISSQISSNDLAHAVKAYQVTDHPPLYFLCLHFWIDLFGHSEPSMRFLSVIFGFLSIVMIYKMGALLFEEKTALLGAFILAISSFGIRYSQEARPYGLVILLSLCSWYFLIDHVRKKRAVVFIGYILSTAGLMYTHYFSCFILFAQNVYIFTESIASKKFTRGYLRKWFLAQGSLLFVYLPWIRILSGEFVKMQKGYLWIPKPDFFSLIGSLKEYAGSAPLLAIFILLLVLLVLSFNRAKGIKTMAEAFQSVKRRSLSLPKDAEGVYLLSLWFLLPLLIPFVVSQFSQSSIYWTRYTIEAMPAFYLLVAKGISSIKYSRARASVIVIIAALSLLSIYNYYIQVNKEQWRDAAEFVDTNAQLGDLVLFYAGFGQTAFDYYSKRPDLDKRPLTSFVAVCSGKGGKTLCLDVKGNKRIWVILYCPECKPVPSAVIKNMLYASGKVSLLKKYYNPHYFNGKYSRIEIYFLSRPGRN